VLGDFELHREIGRGGMGRVYEAWQLSLQRVVALKVLGQHISASPTAVQRFQREAHAAAKLHHTHIVPIYAQGEDNGIHYYAMELVEGPTLHEIVAAAGQDRKLSTASSDSDETVLLDRSTVAVDRPVQRAEAEQERTGAAGSSGSGASSAGVPDDYRTAEHFATVARHIASAADALDYAHREGVVHRDIKPHNLILGGDDRLRISDFGLARVAEEPGVTVTGELVGSPLYMSPEQITEGPGQVDHRTDIYSLGATMYEWLTLTPPYPGETRERVISRILNSEPAPLRGYNPDIPVDLETICLKAIERDPNRRYKTAGGLRDDLRRFLQSRPIKAKRIGLAARLRKSIVRHPVTALAATSGCVVALLASALFVAHLKVQSQKREAESQAAAVAEAQQQTEDLLDLVKPLIPGGVEGPLSIVEAARPMFEGVFDTGQTSTPSGGASQSHGVDSASAGRPEGIARRATRDLYEAVAPRYWPSSPLAHECSYAVLGGIRVRESDAAKARRIVDQCLLSYPDHIEARQLHLALCGQMRQYDTMASDAQQLIQRRRQEPAGYLWLGLARLLLDDAHQGLTDFDRATELAGRRDIRFVWAKALRGLALIGLDRPDDALVELNETLVMAPNLVVALLARACAGATLGDLAGAVADLTRVIEQEPENADTIALRGEHSVRLGRFDRAIRDFNEAMRIGGPTPALQMQVLSALYLQQNKNRARPAPSPTSRGSAVTPDADQSSSSRMPHRHHAPERSGAPRRTRYGVATISRCAKLLFAAVCLR
jgi:serine/threonine protein kinase/tetratricopeptide (TPR) repeat protein